jgi:hypothetical protein
MKRRHRRTEEVILLKDLAPRQDVRGGSGKRVFGEPVETARPSETEREKKPKRPVRLKAEKRKTRGE